MNTISDFVYLVGGLIIAVLIVSLGFMFYNNQKESANTVLDKTSELSSELLESDWTQYDGLEVTGAELPAIVRKFEGTHTYVKINGTMFCYSDEDCTTPADKGNTANSLKDRTSTNYVRQSAKFIGKVVYTDDDSVNGTILGLEFEPANGSTIG